MKLILKRPHKIGGMAVDFKLNSSRDALIGEYQGRRLAIYDYKPYKVMIGVMFGEALFAKLGRTQIERVKAILKVE